MIICGVYKKVGDKINLDFDPVRGVEIDPPQPALIIRRATKQEFMNYWRANAPEELDTSILIHGEPPDDIDFVEVSTN
jgi:hypothetical protein